MYKTKVKWKSFSPIKTEIGNSYVYLNIFEKALSKGRTLTFHLLLSAFYCSFQSSLSSDFVSYDPLLFQHAHVTPGGNSEGG